MADDGKRPHWMQTEAGKKKMARIQKAAWKRRRREGRDKIGPRAKHVPEENDNHAPPPHRTVSHIAPDIVAYALGHVEGWLEQFARGAGVSQSELAARVGAVLSGKIRR